MEEDEEGKPPKPFKSGATVPSETVATLLFCTISPDDVSVLETTTDD